MIADPSGGALYQCHVAALARTVTASHLGRRLASGELLRNARPADDPLLVKRQSRQPRPTPTKPPPPYPQLDVKAARSNGETPMCGLLPQRRRAPPLARNACAPEPPGGRPSYKQLHPDEPPQVCRMVFRPTDQLLHDNPVMARAGENPICASTRRQGDP